MRRVSAADGHRQSEVPGDDVNGRNSDDQREDANLRAHAFEIWPGDQQNPFAHGRIVSAGAMKGESGAWANRIGLRSIGTRHGFPVLRAVSCPRSTIALAT